jgi:hypothetical protein
MRPLLLPLLFLACLASSCASSYVGLYYDSCFAYHRPSTVLKLDANGTFTYKFIYFDTLVTGTWQAHHNVVILRSSLFKQRRQLLTPAIKYTSNDSIDLFRFSSSRLIPVDDSVQRGKCFLKRAKTSDTWWLDMIP